MARDSGRYDAFTDTWIDDNVQVDFAWGNIPMQPNDDRGMAQLDPELDSHIIATSGYEGFPAFITGGIYDDTIPNVAVPNLVGLTDPTAALDALTAVGLVLGDTTSSTAGATSGNNLKVKTQSIAEGTLVNVGTVVDIVVYDYVAPSAPTTGPIATITNPLGQGLTQATEAWMYLLGQTVKPTVGDFISISGNGGTQYNGNNFEVISVANDSAFNTGGTKVKIRSVTGDLAAAGVLGNGGTWTKVG
ncbi:PASTA_pknB domain containing protein [uncultured Caudovirales phage]|uniref:PASTA_pknB domain containing protein n=1 Tax=uncultured Caudovirales phage TaxID=2100421 RepID=A0A6J5KNS9_9CAUD|nr:PASTA_pknB domain containing protein [uncultured Caudovirales phage]